MPIKIDPSKCTLCEHCLRTCPVRVPHIKDGRVAFGPGCIQCGHCAAICPTEAITMGDRPLELVEEFPSSQIKALDSLIRSRRSIRHFKEDPVPRETVQELLTLAVHAPSGANDQLWQFTVIQDPDTLAWLRKRLLKTYEFQARLIQHKRLAPIIARVLGHDPEVVTHPHIVHGLVMLVEKCRAGDDVLTLGSRTLILGHAHRRGATGHDDCVYAMGVVMLAARARGLGTCALGLVQAPLAKDKEARDKLGIPQDHHLHTVLALGFPDEEFLRIPAKKPPVIHWK